MSAQPTNEREAAYYEYVIAESGTPVEDAWQIVGVYGGLVFKWMVFRRYIGNTPDGDNSAIGISKKEV